MHSQMHRKSLEQPTPALRTSEPRSWSYSRLRRSHWDDDADHYDHDHYWDDGCCAFPSQKLSQSVQVQSPPEVSTVNAEDRRKTFYGDQKLRDAGLSILDWANPDLHRRNLDMRIDSTAPMPEAESSGNRVGKQKMAKSHKRKHRQTDKNGRIRSGKSKKMTTPKIKATPKARNQMCYFTALPCII